jgi:hypothetical protein
MRGENLKKKGMTRKVQAWCTNNVLIPGFMLVTGNGTYNGSGPTCHSPAIEPTPWWADLPFCNTVILTIGIAMLVGGVLLWMYIRRKRALTRQLKKGLISKEQYERLK